jgi:excisionase family DNA binding protein
MQLLTAKEVAEILKVKPQTIRLWACKGKIKAYKVGGLRFKLRDIESFVNSQSITPPRPVKEILDTLINK